MSTLSGNRSAPTADLGLTLLRVVVGLTFLAHGLLKLFVFGRAGTAGFFAHVGAPFPAVTSMLVMALESLGAAALVVGLFTRVVAALLACDMIGAIVLARIKGGFFLPNGAEFEILLLACALALALAGAGPWSVDALIRRRRHS